jgi:hypothetical protein
VNIKGAWAFYLTSREVKFCDHLKMFLFPTFLMGWIIGCLLLLIVYG